MINVDQRLVRFNSEVAVIGAGEIGRTHVANLLSLGLAKDSLHICDTDSASRLGLVKDGNFHTRAAEMLERKEIGMVIIAAPPAAHLPLFELCLQTGKDVLLEKPIAVSLADGQAIAALAQQHPERVVVVGFQQRFNPAMHAIKRSLGDLGDLRSFAVNVVMPLEADLPQRKPWLFDRNRGGGVIYESASHNFDLVRWLSGSGLKVVATTTTAAADAAGRSYEARAVIQATLDGGVRFSTEVSFGSETAPFSCEVLVEGSRGTLAYRSSEGITRMRRGVDNKILYGGVGESKSAEPHQELLRHFVQLSQKRTYQDSSAAGVRDGIAALQAVHDAYSLARTRTS